MKYRLLLGREAAMLWLALSWLLPVGFLHLTLHRLILPLVQERHDVRARISTLGRNVYEESWLDSARVGIERDIDLLQRFDATVTARLMRQGTLQSFADSLRQLAESSGMEVLKAEPSRERSGSLVRYRLRLEGHMAYPALTSFLKVLGQREESIWLEEAVLAKKGSSLAARLTLYTWVDEES